MVLCQEQDGKRRVIVYVNRSPTGSEQKYHVHKLEFLALKKFHDYLYNSKFQVAMDNNPLPCMMVIARLDATGHCWVVPMTSLPITSQADRIWQ